MLISKGGMSNDVDIYIAQILPLSLSLSLWIFIAVGLVVKRIRHFFIYILGKKFSMLGEERRWRDKKKENTIRLLLSIYRMACMNREQVSERETTWRRMRIFRDDKEKDSGRIICGRIIENESLAWISFYKRLNFNNFVSTFFPR